MASITGVIDYGVGNVGSVRNILQRSGCRAVLVSNPAQISDVERLILPGIGHFARGMQCLRDGGWVDPIRDAVVNENKPILGICLGMQLLTAHSEEGDCDGLNLVEGHVRHFDLSHMARPLPIPHMGWAAVEVDRNSPLFFDVPENPRFYHVHSYHVELVHGKTQAIAHADYGYRFVTGFNRGNIFGVQFHPEKSHMFGSQVLRNYCTTTC